MKCNYSPLWQNHNGDIYLYVMKYNCTTKLVHKENIIVKFEKIRII